MKIEPPKNHKAADYTRAATKGAIGAIPLAGSILAEVADIILPDPSSEDRKRWEGQITEGHNSLSEQFNSSQVSDATEIVISGAAAIIAKSMIESCSLTLTSHTLQGDRFEQLHAMAPLGHSSTPQDIAQTVKFALENSSITGTTLIVDGGQHLVRTARDFSMM